MKAGDRVRVINAVNGLKQVFLNSTGTVREVSGSGKGFALTVLVDLDKPVRGHVSAWFAPSELEVLE